MHKQKEKVNWVSLRSGTAAGPLLFTPEMLPVPLLGSFLWAWPSFISAPILFLHAVNRLDDPKKKNKNSIWMQPNQTARVNFVGESGFRSAPLSHARESTLKAFLRSN